MSNYVFSTNNCVYVGQNMIGVYHLKYQEPFIGFPTFFFTNLKTYPKLAFFSMSNEINSLQIFYVFKVCFSFMKIRIKKIIPCEPCFINGPQFP